MGTPEDQPLDDTLIEDNPLIKENSFPTLVPSSHTNTFGGDDKFEPPSSSTQRNATEPPMTCAQRPVSFLQDLDMSTVWSPNDTADDAPQRRSVAQGTDPISKFEEAIKKADFTTKDKVIHFCARIYDAHLTQTKTNQKGSDDIMKLLTAIGTLTDQVGILGQAVHKNTADIKLLSEELKNVGDFATDVKSKVAEVIEHINVLTPMSDSCQKRLHDVNKSAHDAWNYTESVSKRVTTLETKTMAATTSSKTAMSEVDRLKADVFRTTNEMRLATQRLEERLRTAQNDVERVQSRVGEEVEAAVRRSESRLSTTPMSTGDTASVGSGPPPSLSPSRRTSYLCSSCNVLFTSSREYQTHTNKVHRDATATPYACNQCNRRFVNQQGLVSHMLGKHNVPATVMPTAEATRDVHLSYLVPGICIPNVAIVDVEGEESRQVLAKIHEVRSDIQRGHIRSMSRLTEDRMIPPGVPYTVLVKFHDPATRAILHEANVAKGGSLRPFLDSNQIHEAKKQVSIGRLPFLGSGAGDAMPNDAGVSITQGPHAGNVQQQRLLPNPGETHRQWAEPAVPQPVGSAPTTAQLRQPNPQSTMTSGFTPIQPIQPFQRVTPLRGLRTQRNHGKGGGARGRGQQF